MVRATGRYGAALERIASDARRPAASLEQSRDLLERIAEEQDRETSRLLLKRLVLRYADAESRVARHGRELEAKQARIAEDLRAAARIQAALLPPPFDLPGIETADRFIPCEDVGGDMLFLRPLDAGHLMAAVLDVSGHGVPAAMVTVSVAQALQPAAGIVAHAVQPGELILTPPREVLRLLDAEYPFARFRRYFTLIYGLLEVATGRFTYAIGGHPAPHLVRADGSVSALPGDGPIPGVGMGDDFEQSEVDLAPGDRIVLHSDGCSECADPAGGFYTEERFRDSLRRHAALPLKEMIAAVAAEATDFVAPGTFQDDYTLLALRYAREPGEGRR